MTLGSRLRICLMSVITWIAPQILLAQTTKDNGASSSPGQRRADIERALGDLTGRLQQLRGRNAATQSERSPQIADAEIFAKGITWALRYDGQLEKADLALLTRSLDRCRTRIAALEAGTRPWETAKGSVVRGFISAIDGSVQPYGMIVPRNYDRSRPMRLDVVLHGSSKPVGISELRFMNRFDGPDDRGANAPEGEFLELHPLGRVENGYRWAGETDVFEAIEAACRNYAIDRDRIVLRGMSMGASGTWHVGLKHPDAFVALGPYCGYVDTHEFSRTPLPNFVQVGPLPAYQEKMLHMLDSVDYAANARAVPAIACIGEKDVFFQAHVIMGRAMEKEGLAMVNLISPGTGHVQDPVTFAEQMRRIGAIAEKGRDHLPPRIHFVTWTLKYSRCDWLQVLGMEEHYRRADLDARLVSDGDVEVLEAKNVSRFAILPPVASARALRVRVEGSDIAVPAIAPKGAGRKIVFGKQGGRWACLGVAERLKLEGKQPGLQGPIDDAFTGPFLCVRGTGQAWHPAIQAWSEARLKQFAYEWNRYFRGELAIKDDTAVTQMDAERFNLILFGDPGSNAWIRRVLPALPIRWTRTECAIGTRTFDAANHVPLLIQPNPLASGRYVVFNSGHTFGENELSTLNYLLFPRLADWAIVRLSDQPDDQRSKLDVVQTDFFDERWRVKVE